MARIERGAPLSAERGGSRGRRDPALRQRIETDQPVYTDDTPDGVVGVRGPERGNEAPEGSTGQVVNLNELSDEEYMDLVDQGLITDGDEGEVEIDLGELVGDEEDELDQYLLLSPGDVVYAKVHHPVRFDNDPSNFTYGIARRIQDGESEAEAFEIVSTIVNTRALDLAKAAMQPVMEFKDDVDRARREQVNSRSQLRPRQSREKE